MNDEIKLPDGIETRFLKLEVRAEKRADEKPVIKGQAAVFNQEVIIRGWFREKILPGAFQRVLSYKPDTIGCFNHDWNMVLGRTTAGTLSLKETPDGLDYEIDINPDDPEAMSVYAKVARGDVSQSSFAFMVGVEEWIYPPDNSKDLPLRSITEFSELYDVCPATFGAYPQTSAAVRSKFQLSSEEPELQTQAASDGAEEIAMRQKSRRRKLELSDLSIAK
jgi:hypothetical protein